MALPGTFFLLQGVASLLQSANGVYNLLLLALYSVLAPGVIFGGLGAIALAFLTSPAKRIRTLLVATVTGLACPLALLGALIVFFPKNEGTLGWVISGYLYAATGAFAGFTAAKAVLSEPWLN
jgi:hypothetical protein